MNQPDQLRRAGKGDVRGPGGPDEALTQPNPTPLKGALQMTFIGKQVSRSPVATTLSPPGLFTQK